MAAIDSDGLDWSCWKDPLDLQWKTQVSLSTAAQCMDGPAMVGLCLDENMTTWHDDDITNKETWSQGCPCSSCLKFDNSVNTYF